MSNGRAWRGGGGDAEVETEWIDRRDLQVINIEEDIVYTHWNNFSFFILAGVFLGDVKRWGVVYAFS